MTTPLKPAPNLRVNEEEIDIASPATRLATSTASNRYDGINITRLPTDDDDEIELVASTSSILHVYSKGEVHQLISPIIDPSKERTSGPKSKEQKAEKEERKRIRQDPTLADNDENAFFLHRPYLAFHVPPRVLYAGNTKYGKPIVLIHAGGWWKYFKLQLGPSLGEPGVLDPRGVVSWKHNGGDKQALKADDRKLKGYKVRTWRLWGEHGKEYVQNVKKNRKAKEGPDPDVFEKDDSDTSWPRKADEVVYLRWTSPISRRTRQYHFKYAGIEFQWKGTGTVKETKRCGAMLRFNHLKLVAILPKDMAAKEEKQDEICLGKYTSSIATEKYGKLEFLDAAILQLAEEHLPYLLEQAETVESATESGAVAEEGETKLARIKRSTLYQLFVATAMCMVLSEQEKRHTVLAFILEAGEGGG